MMRRIPSAQPYRKVLGIYEYHENKVVGRGSNSVVYEGSRIDSRQPICVKQINIRTHIAEKLANNEIEVLRKLDHPHLLKYIAHFHVGSYLYIITEKCQNNLFFELKKKGKMPQSKALSIFLQILQGYQGLRSKGYIHRDIKPDNILLKDGSFKLADFGFSIPLRRNSTRESFNVGTPIYMAPEALNCNIYSEKSDIWSLGVTLHQLLHGVTPFISKSQEELKREIIRPVKIHASSEAMTKLISSCLCYQVRNRFNLSQLIEAVKEMQSQLTRRESCQKEEEEGLKKSYIGLNEIHYIHLLEHVQHLSSKTKLIGSHLKERINFLFEHQIRMRLKLIQPLFTDYKGLISRELDQKYRQCQRKHCHELQFPQNISSNDRLHYFNKQIICFSSSLQWQTQAELKNLISSIFKESAHLLTEQRTIINENLVKLTDFILSAFILNSILIQKENNFQDFAKLSHLNIILSCPSRVNLQVWTNIRKKAEDLKLI